MKRLFMISLSVLLLAGISISMVSCSSEESCLHEWSQWTVMKEATCGESGYSNRQCAKCGEVDRSVQYTLPHSFSEQWIYDGTYHWHTATCIHKNEISEKGVHTFVGNTCSVCGALRATQGLEYRGNLGQGTYRVAGIGSTLDDNIVVARYYNGAEIVGVDNDAFNGVYELKSIALQQYVTHIGDRAFKDCTGLTQIQFSSSVDSLGAQMLSGCSSLVAIVFVGTMEEWEALPKGADWDKGTANYAVYCSDGTIAK